MTTIKVIAKAGTKCPKEGNPREYITDTVAEDVPISIYYLRLINDGSLEREKEPEGHALPVQESGVKPEPPDPKNGDTVASVQKKGGKS